MDYFETKKPVRCCFYQFFSSLSLIVPALAFGAALPVQVKIGTASFSSSALSLWLAKYVSTLLYGISPHDPVAICAVVAIVAGAGFAACYFPARRATRVDPMIALRYE